MAERTKIPEIKNDEGSQLDRLFEATAPKVGAALTVPIILRPVLADVLQTKNFMCGQAGKDAGMSGCVVMRTNLPNRIDAVVAFVTPLSANTELLQSSCEAALHQYLVPVLIHTMEKFPSIDDDNEESEIDPNISQEVEEENNQEIDMIMLESMALPIFLNRNIVKPRTDMEMLIEEIWRGQLCSSTTVR